MAIERVTLRDNFVYRDSVNTWRWYDAIGDGVIKWEETGLGMAVDDSSGNPTAYTTTEVGTNTITMVDGALGGRILITTGGTENNGLEIQLLGEAFSMNGNRPTYFGCRFAVNDADQVDAVLGLGIQDTTFLAGASDGLVFRTDDESAALQLIAEKNSNESAISAATLTDGVYVTAEYYYDGTTCTAYINGSAAGSIADTDANWPNDEYLTPTIGILTGETAAQTLTVEWARAIQLV